MDKEKFERLLEINDRIEDIKNKRDSLELYIETKIFERGANIEPIIRGSNTTLKQLTDDIITTIRSHYDDTELNKLKEEFDRL